MLRTKKKQVIGISSLTIDRVAKSFLVIKREKDPHKGCYSLPGGSLERGELIQEGQVRETLEETGYIAEPYRFSKGSQRPNEYVSEMLWNEETYFVIMTNLFQIVKRDDTITNTDCEFEFLGLKPGLEHPYFRDVIRQDNSSPSLLDVLEYFESYLEE